MHMNTVRRCPLAGHRQYLALARVALCTRRNCMDKQEMPREINLIKERKQVEFCGIESKKQIALC